MSAPKTCPSAPCAPGAKLIGVKNEQGRITPMRTALEVDETFIAEASTHGNPEARMRFAASCETKGCAQWTGTRCGVIDRVMDFLQDKQEFLRSDLQPCAIRGSCRWFDQMGASACLGCELVTTDQRA